MMNLAPIMTAAAERAADRIAAAGPRAVDLLDEMVTTTFDVIADVTFSGGDTFDRDGVHKAIDDYVAEAGKFPCSTFWASPTGFPARAGWFRAGG